MAQLRLEDNAVISECGLYRYLLTRQVGSGERTATFIMLNPSTADATEDDPTIRRCIGFARQWECGRLAVLNLFAFRATDPRDLKRATEPVGPDNRRWIRRVLTISQGPVICGWGVHGDHMGQDQVVLGWLRELDVQPQALGLTTYGFPRHPLYVPYSADLRRFSAA